eukprot:XP_015583149.1 uncharacterized protein LOC107262346 [Ricinus communis]
MDATHLLLGHPWQYDKKTVHDGLFNTYTFQHKGHRVTLLPMTPYEIIHDHVERDRIKALEQTKEAIKPMATTKPQHSPNLKASTKAEYSTGPATLPIFPTTHEAPLTNEETRGKAKKQVIVREDYSWHVREISPQSFRDEFADAMPDEIPEGLPQLRRIEHQIDLIPGAFLPNRIAYWASPEETKELQRQVTELL